MSLHSCETWLFEMPDIPMALTRSSTARVDTPWMYASWIDRNERLLGSPPWFEEGRQIRPLPQLRDLEIHRAGARLPTPISIAIAVVSPIFTALTKTGAAKAFDFEIHQPL